MVHSSKTVTRGWSQVLGESRDINKDLEATALDNLEVRRGGDVDDIHTHDEHQETVRDDFCPPILLRLPFPSAARVPLLTFPAFFTLEAPDPPISVFSSGHGPICLCGVGAAGVGERERDQGV